MPDHSSLPSQGSVQPALPDSPLLDEPMTLLLLECSRMSMCSHTPATECQARKETVAESNYPRGSSSLAVGGPPRAELLVAAWDGLVGLRDTQKGSKDLPSYCPSESPGCLTGFMWFSPTYWNSPPPHASLAATVLFCTPL